MPGIDSLGPSEADRGFTFSDEKELVVKTPLSREQPGVLVLDAARTSSVRDRIADVHSLDEMGEALAGCGAERGLVEYARELEDLGNKLNTLAQAARAGVPMRELDAQLRAIDTTLQNAGIYETGRPLLETEIKDAQAA